MAEVRLNRHMEHLEDLVWEDQETLIESITKMEDFIEDIEKSTSNLHITRKIDGSPAVVVWHHIEGMPDDSISLKGSFLGRGSKNYSSDDDIYAAYDGDMAKMLHYTLMLAPYIPDGEAWQGDCLFTEETLKHETIEGVDYISFKPNTIDYVFPADSPSGNAVAEKEFGISFHTKFTGAVGDFSQSFRLDASVANFPEWAYVLSPCVDWKSADINLDSLKGAVAVFKESASALLENPAYVEAINNPVFKSFWARFTNNNLSDHEAVKYDEAKFVDQLITFCEESIEGAYHKADLKTAELKTDKGRITKRNKLYDKRLQDLEDALSFIDNNEDILRDIVTATNACVDVKMQIVDALDKLDPGYKTFYLDDENNYIPAAGEGYAMSDADGNVIKLVNRATFSHANRTFGAAAARETTEHTVIKRKHDILLERVEAYHKFTQMLEAEKKTAAVAYGRMNPPTIGHRKLVETLANAASENDADSFLFLSNSHDTKKNPLTPEQKKHYADKAFGGMVDEIICDERSKQFLYALNWVMKQGYKNLVYVCGEDEYQQFSDMLNKYNGFIDDRTTEESPVYFKFDGIKIVNVGARSGDDEVSNASATKARKAAADGDFAAFSSIVAVDKDVAEDLYKDLRIGMGISELTDESLDENVEKNVFTSFFRQRLSEATSTQFTEEFFTTLGQTPRSTFKKVNKIKDVSDPDGAETSVDVGSINALKDKGLMIDFFDVLYQWKPELFNIDGYEIGIQKKGTGSKSFSSGNLVKNLNDNAEDHDFAKDSIIKVGFYSVEEIHKFLDSIKSALEDSKLFEGKQIGIKDEGEYAKLVFDDKEVILALRASQGGRGMAYFPQSNSVGFTGGASMSLITKIEETATCYAYNGSSLDPTSIAEEVGLNSGSIDDLNSVSSTLASWQKAINAVSSCLKSSQFKDTVGPSFSSDKKYIAVRGNEKSKHFSEIEKFFNNSLYKGTSRDTVNPADIVLMREDSIDEIKKIFGSSGRLENAPFEIQKGLSEAAKFAYVTNKLLEDGKLIGVSLKKPEDESAIADFIGTRLKIENTKDSYVSIIKGEETIKEDSITIVDGNENSSSRNITAMIDDKHTHLFHDDVEHKITFCIRPFTKGPNASVEIIGLGGARGGKLGGKNFAQAMTRYFKDQNTSNLSKKDEDFLKKLSKLNESVLNEATADEYINFFEKDNTFEKLSVALAGALKYPIKSNNITKDLKFNSEIANYIKVH